MPDWKKEILKRLAGLKLEPTREAEIVEELSQHLEDRYREFLATGMAEDAARKTALEELDVVGARHGVPMPISPGSGGEDTAVTANDLTRGLQRVERRVNQEPVALGGDIPPLQSGGGNFFASLWQDLRYGLRQLRKNPGFSVIAILILAFGIGANSAVFSAIDAIVFRPLPFPDGDQLMELEQTNPKTKGPEEIHVAPVRLQDWNRMNSTFQAITGYYTENESDVSGALPQRVTLALVAPRFLQVWGVSPELGHDFSPEEERFGGPCGFLISDRYWRSRLDADPKVIGKKIKLSGFACTVDGVMPPSFLFPDRDVNLWSPVPMDAPYAQSRESTWFITIGRLKPGRTTAQARADLETVQSQLGKQFPKTDAELNVDVIPLKEIIVGDERGTLWVLYGSVSLLLLIVCTNMSALLLGRGAQREQEIAVRCALGASRRRVAAQLITEVFVLALAGAALGILIAGAASQAFRSLAGTLPRADEIALNWRIVAYSVGCALACTFLCGVFPAVFATRRTLSAAMARGGRTQVSTRNSLHWLLVGAQVALAVTLLDGAGLLVRSMRALGQVSPGFDPYKVLTLHISGGYGETADMKTLTQRIDRDLDSLRDLPGVQAAATSATLPGVPTEFQSQLKLSPRPAKAEDTIVAQSRFVSPGYFATMRIPQLAGESCSEKPGSVAAVVNRSFAEAYLPGMLPMGHHLDSVGHAFGPSGNIVGMVGDAREEGINHPPVPTVYWCISAPMPDPNFLIRTSGSPMAMAQTLRLKIREVEPNRSVYGVMPLEEHLGEAFSDTRLRTLLLTLFALSAVSLMCMGLYGTLSFLVRLRRREIGVRLALGASQGEIVRRFVSQGLRVALLGSAVGLGVAAAGSQLLSGMLYGVTPSDLVTISVVVLAVLAVATASSLLPAVRASRVEPMEVLRNE